MDSCNSVLLVRLSVTSRHIPEHRRQIYPDDAIQAIEGWARDGM